jgi:hypothetical protein
MNPRYRLHGDVGGVECAYLLAPGPNRIGSVGGNDIVLREAYPADTPWWSLGFSLISRQTGEVLEEGVS